MFKALLSVVVSVGLMATGAARAADPVVMMTWGGVWQKTFTDLATSYREKTGREVRIVAQTSADAGLARLIAQKDKPEIDLWTPNMVNYIRALKAGALGKLDASAVPNAADLPPQLKLSHGVVGWISQRGIFYRKDLAPFEPAQWKDLWDPRMKGKLAAPAATFDAGYFPLAIALANGGNDRALDVAFRELVTLKGNISAFYTNNVQSIRMLEAGEVAVVAWGVLPNVIQYLGPGSKYGFVVPAPAMVAETPFALVAGSKRRQETLDFVNFLLAPESQAQIASAFGSTPANPKAPIPDSLNAILSVIPKSYVVDYDFLSENLDKIVDRYDREVMNR